MDVSLMDISTSSNCGNPAGVEVSSPPKAGEKRNLTKRGVSSLEMLLDGGKSKRTRWVGSCNCHMMPGDMLNRFCFKNCFEDVCYKSKLFLTVVISW